MKSVPYYLLILLVFCLAFNGCKKEETLVTGNEAPEDPTVPNILRENYVQKAYLNLYGRQPSDSEKTAGLAILNKGNCSVSNRTELLNSLFANNEYRLQLYNIENADMLEGITDEDLKAEVVYFEQKLIDPSNSDDYYLILAELEKTKLLQGLKNNLLNGLCNMVNAHKIISDSPNYESITGSRGEWVNAIFKRFLFREATEKEIENCEDILDARSGTLFLLIADSKDELINIFFSSDEYYEGQVRTLYQRYLYREPEPDVAISLSHEYKTKGDYQALQKKILLTNEFLGIK